MNKYWEIGEKNSFGKECYKLHFTEFYDDEVVVAFVQDEVDEDTFIYISEIMNVEYETIIADSVDDAKQQLEDMIIDYWNDEIATIESRIDKFKETE